MVALLLAFVSPADPRVRANIERSAIVLALGFVALVVLVMLGLRRAGARARRVRGWLAVGLTCIELCAVGAGARRYLDFSDPTATEYGFRFDATRRSRPAQS